MKDQQMLRAATDRLRALAGAVERDMDENSSRWRSDTAPRGQWYANGLQNALGGAPGDFAAAMTPELARAIADWLEAAALAAAPDARALAVAATVTGLESRGAAAEDPAVGEASTARAERVADVLNKLTPQERDLLTDLSLAGYRQGAAQLAECRALPERQIVRSVLGPRLNAPHRYPALAQLLRGGDVRHPADALSQLTPFLRRLAVDVIVTAYGQGVQGPPVGGLSGDQVRFLVLDACLATPGGALAVHHLSQRPRAEADMEWAVRAEEETHTQGRPEHGPGGHAKAPTAPNETV